tara:strand:+ start:70 stop:1563 length:1494 start_codon:yes stop_codon:yes gene_type:complete
MSIEKLQSIFDQDFKDAQKGYIGKYALPKTLTTFELGGIDQLNDMVRGANQVMQQYGVEFNKDINTPDVWSKVSAKLGKEYGRTRDIGGVKIGTYKAGRAAPPKPGVYFGVPISQVTMLIPLNIYAKNATAGQRFIKQIWDGYVSDLYEAWVEFVWPKSVFKQQALGTPPGYESADTQIQRYSESAKKMTEPTISKAFKINLKKEHEITSTTAMMAVDAMRNSKPSVKSALSVDYTDLVQSIQDSISVDWMNSTKKKNLGNYQVKNVLSIKLGSNPGLDTDAPALKKHAYEYIKNDITDRFAHRLTDADLELSKPAGDQAAEDVITELMAKAIKGSKKAKQKKKQAKKLSTKPRKASLKKTKQTKRAKGKMRLSQNALLVRKPSSEKKKEDNNKDLLKLEAMINKRLPAEVRRNMGRPALRNQTGIFSNSVEAQNFRYTKAGVSGEFTYQLSPYETFENTGSRRWPTGYNPKPLIAKSIRNLALQYTAQKLVSLRRT